MRMNLSHAVLASASPTAKISSLLERRGSASVHRRADAAKAENSVLMLFMYLSKLTQPLLNPVVKCAAKWNFLVELIPPYLLSPPHPTVLIPARAKST